MNGNATMYWRVMIWGLASLSVMLPALAPAMMVTVKATVTTAPCIINGAQPIEVEFGDVMTTRVDGRNHKTLVRYTLSCSGSPANMMKLQVEGNGAPFDSTVLLTDKAGLGIELYQKDSKLPINSWLNFTQGNPPQLWAVPVKQSGFALTGGEFNANATMKVTYQ